MTNFLAFCINLLCSNPPTGLFQTIPKQLHLWIKTLRKIFLTFSHLSPMTQTMWSKLILLNISRYNVQTVISVCVTDVLNVSMITLCANRIFCKRLKIVFWRIHPYEESCGWMHNASKTFLLSWSLWEKKQTKQRNKNFVCNISIQRPVFFFCNICKYMFIHQDNIQRPVFWV